ncbi:MAG: hypothetical protein Q9160_001114 [Pyrenula sp. 1 TL-2023]
MPKFVPRQRKQQKTRRKGFEDEHTKAAPSKKQKRLEKYIENKLKKEENLALLKKLSRDKFQTSNLQSSRNLKRKHADFLTDLRPPKRANSPANVADVSMSDSLSSSDDEDLKPIPQHEPAAQALVTQNNNGNSNPSLSGSGLKEPLILDTDGHPIIQKRQRRKVLFDTTNEPMPTRGVSSSSDWSTESNASEINDSGSDTNSLQETGSGSALDETSQSEMSDDESEESQSEREGDHALVSKPRVRESAFKTWASQKINESVGFTPSSQISQPMQSGKEERSNGNVTANEPLALQSKSNGERSNARKAYYVPVSRSENIQQQRAELPVVVEEQKIMEAIHNHPIVIISGDTGSGKTTQIPQFLLEAGYGDSKSPTPGMVGITQPRRVAAVSMAKRVSMELGDMAEKVSYKIRFDDKTSAKTAIKFMTDGILLREITQDFALSKYSIIVLDEAHERSVNTDMLIGMLTRIVDLRKKLANDNQNVRPLQLVIMSATLHESEIVQNTKLFRHAIPPVVSVEGRQFPVSIHWSRRTQRDYIEGIFRKVCKGHRKLPPGAFLVFLNGENEIRAIQRRLDESLSSTKHQSTAVKVQIAASEIPAEIEDFEVGAEFQMKEDDHIVDELDFYGEDEEEDEDAEFEVDTEENAKPASKVHILPLYSQLRTADQMRVFEKPPDGSRLIALATNVAETSLTIPGIRYVFDCGRSKQRRYDQQSGIQTFEIDWISKASAKQRSGRAGRTGPGHCYRLYSSAVYEQDFPENTQPEITTTPIESVVLQLKSMGIDNVEKFPFPTSPDHHSLLVAQRLLENLGLISLQGKVTQLGREVSIYPLSPRLAKMLAIGSADSCLPYVVAMVAAIAVPELFVPENQLDLTVPDRDIDSVYTAEDQCRDNLREERRKKYDQARARLCGKAESADALKMLTAVCAYADGTNASKFCDEFFLRPKALKEALQLRQQLTSIIRANYPSRISSFQADLPPLGKKTAQISTKLKQLITAGYLDQVTIRADMSPSPPEMPSKPRRAIDVPYLPLIPLSMTSSEVHEKAVFVHPSSILARLSPSELPQYLIYSHLQKAAAPVVGGDKIPKTRMFPLTPATGSILAALADGTPLLDYGKPIGKVESLGGLPERRQCWVVPSLVGSAGSLGWPLPAKKVLQRKDPKEGWVVEKFLTGK